MIAKHCFLFSSDVVVESRNFRCEANVIFRSGPKSDSRNTGHRTWNCSCLKRNCTIAAGGVWYTQNSRFKFRVSLTLSPSRSIPDEISSVRKSETSRKSIQSIARYVYSYVCNTKYTNKHTRKNILYKVFTQLCILCTRVYRAIREYISIYLLNLPLLRNTLFALVSIAK